MTEDAGTGRTYGERIGRFAEQESRAARASRRYSVIRLVVFFLAATCFAVALLVQAGASDRRLLGLGVALVVLFFALVKLHDRVIRRQRHAGRLRLLNEEAAARLERAWDRLPPPAAAPADAPAFARDLSLFGPASLMQLLGTAWSPPGRSTLGRWLLEPASPPEIRRRQELVTALAPQLELRQELEARTRELAENAVDPEAFLRWAEGESWLRHRRYLLWVARGLGVAAVVLTFAALAGWVPYQVTALLLLLNLAFSYALARQIHGAFVRASVREGVSARYARVFELLSEDPRAIEALGEHHRDLTVGEQSAYQEMDRLHRLVELSDLRLSMFHFVVQALTLWDFHVLHAMEGWQERCGPRVRTWFRALGEIEALCALAGLRFDNPEWALPEVAVQESPSFAARALGHPLLVADQRVTNDVTLGPPGSFLLVTGSNMSGKSTLLRAAGINAVLAQAGGPVCAAELRLPPLILGTSILIEDSLAAGTSYYMAELLRLKQIVDTADRVATEGGPVLLYLLDEVLRGTNSAERQIAVQKVLLHLVDRGAVGAISTHDLELGSLPALAAASRPCHFRETVHPPGHEPPMSFDYHLRPGVATTTNALKLLELVGLDFAPDADSAS